MGKICKNCNYERKLEDIAPYFECPKCGMIYAKSEKILEDKKKQEYAVLSERAEVATPTTQKGLPNKFIKLFILILIICTGAGIYLFFQVLSDKNSIKTTAELKQVLAEDTSDNPFQNMPADYEMTTAEFERTFKNYYQDNKLYQFCNRLIRITGIKKNQSLFSHNNKYIIVDDNKLNIHPCHEAYMENISKKLEFDLKCRLECGHPISWNCVLDTP